MKHQIAITLFCAMTLSTWGQLVQPGSSSSGEPNSASSPSTIPEFGPHHHVLQPADVSGTGQQRGKVVEVASGLNYWNGTNWVQSEPVFDVTTNGFVASRLQHSPRLSQELNRMGAVVLKTPQGDVISSTPIGIGLMEPMSGQFGLIATLTNSTGVLIGENEVAYENPFYGICSTLYYHIE